MIKNYTYVIVKGEDNAFVASVPEIPGIIAQGSTIEELKPRIKESIEAYIQVLKNERLSVPQDFNLIKVEQIEVEV